MRLKVTEVHVYTVPKEIEHEVKELMLQRTTRNKQDAQLAQEALDDLLTDMSDDGIYTTTSMEILL